MANLTDADKVLRNDVGKSIVSKLDDIADAIVQHGGGAESLGQLSDVNIDTTTLAEGQSIVYNETTQKFENGQVSTVAALDDLTDVSITSAQQGDSLRNDGNGNWINEPTKIVMTQAQWNAIADKQAWRNAHKNTDLILSDAPNLNATAQDISYDGGADTVWDKVEAKANTSDLPTWITQASGTNSGTIAGASVFGYYYADQWQAYIYLPFVAKNTNYTVNLTSVSADNIGDVTSKCSVVAKQNGYFTVRTTKTMSNLPDYYSVCPMRITYSIDFA